MMRRPATAAATAGVRRLAPEDAALWRDIRLEALAREPAQFAERLADWADRPLRDFAAHLAAVPVWAAVAGERALAVAALTPDSGGEACGWIEAVYVRPEARGRGLGQAVVAAAEDAARARRLAELRLQVRGANAAARGLYRKLGFREVAGGREGGCGGCEVTMAKRL